jgi:hypothetical protein
METFRKVPTCLLYDERGQVLAWGLEAKNANPVPGSIKCEWYDMVTATIPVSKVTSVTSPTGSNYSSSLMHFEIRPQSTHDYLLYL